MLMENTLCWANLLQQNQLQKRAKRTGQQETYDLVAFKLTHVLKGFQARELIENLFRPLEFPVTTGISKLTSWRKRNQNQTLFDRESQS